MMKRSYLARVACVVFLCTSATAFVARAVVSENIEFDAVSDFFQNPDGSNAALGDAVLLGLFPVGFDFSANQTFASLSAAFTQLASTTIISPGQFSGTVNVTTAGFEGRQLYIWVLNNATPSSATAWAIVTNTTGTTWKVPADQSNTIIDTGDVGVFVPIGARGQAIMPQLTAPNNSNWRMTLTVVPEPSSIALLGAGIGLVPLLRRRIA